MPWQNLIPLAIDATASSEKSHFVPAVYLTSTGRAYSRCRYARLRIEELNSRETNDTHHAGGALGFAIIRDAAAASRACDCSTILWCKYSGARSAWLSQVIV